jgi:4-amino-4-deoxy-L-arabinose transferase-like glycosyltransferase
LIGTLSLVYLGLASLLAPQDDEVYYWCWSQRLQLSYYDHAPLTAWLIALSTAIFGNNVVAMRLPSIACALVAVAVVYRLSPIRSLMPLILLTPAFLLVGIIITPDSPLLAMWALYVLWLVRIHERLESDSATLGFWMLGGLILGCSILGKYTAGLAIPSGLVSFLFVKNWRRWAPGYALHLATAFVVTLPILIYNIGEDFAPLLYQWRHATDNDPWSFQPIGEFLGVQVLAAGLLPLVMFVWSIWHFRRLTHQPLLRVCACMFVLPFAFFLYKGVRMRLEANWPLVSYVAVWPIAAAWYASVRHSLKWRLITWSWFAIPSWAVVILVVHSFWPISLVPTRGDRITRQTNKDAIARELAANMSQYGEPAPVFVRTYQWVALLRFYQIDAHPMFGEDRPSHFTNNSKHFRDQDRFYILGEEYLGPEHAGDRRPTVAACFPLDVRGDRLSNLTLIEYSKR